MVRTLKSVVTASLASENMASKKGASRSVSAAVMSVALDCAEDKQLKALRQAQYQYVLNSIAENPDLVLPRLIAALDADKNRRERTFFAKSCRRFGNIKEDICYQVLCELSPAFAQAEETGIRLEDLRQILVSVLGVRKNTKYPNTNALSMPS